MKKDGVTGISSINGAGATFLLNAGRGTNPPLADVNLRRAIAHAIDLKLFNDRVYGGKALASSGLVHPDQRTYPGTDGPTYDVAQAKSLVAAAKAAGYNGNITITCGDTPSAIEQTITLKAMLEAVGFTVTMQNLPAAQSLQVILIEGNYQIGCGGLSLFDEGMVRGMNQFASTSVRNRVGIKDAKMDAGINQLYQAKDEAEVTKAMANLQTVWNDIVPAANVFASEWFNAYHDNVHGLVSNRDGTILFHDAWVD
jgi:peptide/nickel transport system substrate-binding protein